MKKSDEIKWLEKVFAAEVENRLPFQTKATIMKRMEASGLVQFGSEKMGQGPFPVTVSGWYLTHRGRIMYCNWAAKQK